MESETTHEQSEGTDAIATPAVRAQTQSQGSDTDSARRSSSAAVPIPTPPSASRVADMETLLRLMEEKVRGFLLSSIYSIHSLNFPL